MIKLYNTIDKIENSLLRAFCMSCYLLLWTAIMVAITIFVTGVVVLLSHVGGSLGVIATLLFIIVNILVFFTLIFYLIDKSI